MRSDPYSKESAKLQSRRVRSTVRRLASAASVFLGGVLGNLTADWITPEGGPTIARSMGTALGAACFGLTSWALSRPTGMRAGAISNPGDEPQTTGSHDGSRWHAAVCPWAPASPALFVGRDDLVMTLALSLATGSDIVVTQALSGMGGVGKTSVAAAVYASSHRLYAISWWVRAETPATMMEDYAAISRHVGVPRTEDLSTDAHMVRVALEGFSHPWLIVFDNVTDYDDLGDLLPRQGTGSVIITSRSTTFPPNYDVHRLDTLPPKDAENFLRSRVQRDNPEAASEDVSAVVERLDGLALALEQAGAWVAAVPNRRFDQFVKRYDTANGNPSAAGDLMEATDRTASATWMVSIDAATEKARWARTVMEVLCHLGPDELPCHWLRETVGDPYLGKAREIDIDRALAALHTYSLATVTTRDTVSVHRVVQAATRRTSAEGAVSAALRCIRRQAPGDPRDHNSWLIYRTIAPHAIALALAAGPGLASCAADLCTLLGNIVTYQRQSGSVKSAIGTATIATNIAVAHLGESSQEALLAHHNLARAYWSAGRLAEAVERFESNLTNRVSVLGPGHEDSLMSRHHLAVGYRSIGRVVEAIELLTLNLRERLILLGPGDPETMVSRHHLAIAYRAAGHLWRAIFLFQSNLAERTVRLGAEDIDTLISRHHLAVAYKMAGLLDMAIPMYERTLADRIRVLGADHPHALISRHDLAAAYRATGRFADAFVLYHEVIDSSSRVLGADHPNTLQSRSNLGVTYLAAEKFSDAAAVLKSVLRDRERVLGVDHPHTKNTRDKLSVAEASLPS